MAVNYEDERFKAVENEKNEAISNATNEYNNMINQAQGYYQQQIDAQKEWGQKQSEIQQANTDFAIEKIEQQKAQTQKDYVKEQKGAYTDYQKAIDEYGVNAEQRASSGLNNSGYSESSRISAYNTYQNRYASARESYNNALMNYANAIKEAQLANSSALAQIAYQAQQAQLELSLQGFQYKNTLVLQKMDALNAIGDRYHNKYQDVLAQINTENALAEQVRQYNESLAFQREQAQREQSNWEKELEFKRQQAQQDQANWEKEYALAKASSSKSSSGNTQKIQLEQPRVEKYAVETPYYKGDLNPDAKNGTFNSPRGGVNYQPDNVNGKKLSSSGDTITFNTETLDGQAKTVTQTIWKTSDGTRYYWDGRYNQYIKIK